MNEKEQDRSEDLVSNPSPFSREDQITCIVMYVLTGLPSANLTLQSHYS
jgi:hypothetical protein